MDTMKSTILASGLLYTLIGCAPSHEPARAPSSQDQSPLTLEAQLAEVTQKLDGAKELVKQLEGAKTNLDRASSEYEHALSAYNTLVKNYNILLVQSVQSLERQRQSLRKKEH